MPLRVDRLKKLAHMKIDSETKALLAGFGPRLCVIIRSILEEFHAYISRSEQAAAVFENKRFVERARKVQLDHWERMFSGRFDDEYFDSAKRIGKAHYRLGLEPSWHIGGYALVKQALIQHVLDDACGNMFLARSRKIAGASRLLQAIDRAIALDVDLAVFVFLAQKNRSVSNRLNGLADEFSDVIARIAADLTVTAGQLRSGATELADNIEKTGKQITIAVSGTERISTNLRTLADAASGAGPVAKAVMSVSTAAARTYISAGSLVLAASDVRAKANQLEQQSREVIDRIRNADQSNAEVAC